MAQENGQFFTFGTFGGVKKAIVGHVLPVSKDPRKIGTSQLRSKERRAADPAVKERAAVHAAGQEAAAREEILPSPEKLGSNTSLESLSGPDFFQRPLKIIIFCGGVRSPNPLRSVGWGT